MEKFGHNSYHLSEPLPEGVSAQILEKAEEFLAFLENTKTTTHPVIRALYNGVELQLASLVGLAEAEKFRKAGGEDEMDVWKRNGTTPI